MGRTKKILLKITGEIFLSKDKKNLSAQHILSVISQIKKLKQEKYQFGIVIGGGNFFRGSQHGKQLGLSASVGHQIGIFATLMNGLILKDLFEQHDMETVVFCAITCPQVGPQVSSQKISAALKKNKTAIFTGGTGNPFFTNDTNAVLRGLQMCADEIWKGTNIDGVYSKNPRKFPDAHLIKHLTYHQALDKQLNIMDATAFALAQTYKQTIRIFDIFAPDALINAAQDKNFGSTIQPKQG